MSAFAGRKRGRMDLKRLQFMVRVVETGSFTRAATALRIAQPALSQHMQALERSAGTKLLVRGKDGVTPTPAGRVAYRHAKTLARQLDRARTEVRMLATTPAGRVTVGMSPHSQARQLIQPMLTATAARYPDILLHVSENFEGVLAEDLRLGRMDMALLYEISPRPGFRSEPVSTEELCLVGSRALLGPAVAGLTASVPLLLPSTAHVIRQLVEAVYSRRRIRPDVVAEIESYETLAAAVAEGVGATVLPRPVAAPLATRTDIVLRRFGTSPTRITLSLVTPSDDADRSEAARAVHSLLAGLASGRSVPA